MGNIERRLEQEKLFVIYKSRIKIFNEKDLFVLAIAQCFLKGKMPENKLCYAKYAKMTGKG